MRPFIVSHARIHPDVENAVAAYAMELRNGVVPDLSGFGFDAAVNGSPMAIRHILGSGLQFDGVADYLDSGNVGTINSACFWMSPDTTTEDIADFDGGTHTIEISAGTLSATGFASPTLYVNGAVGASVVADAYQLIGVSTATGFSATALQWGLLTGKIIGMFRVSNIEESATWFAEQYALGKRALWKTNPVDNAGNVTSGYIGDSPFVMKSGTSEIADALINNENSKVINAPSGDNRFYLPTSITGQTQKESSYGRWDYSIYNTGTNNVYVQFIANNTDFVNIAGHDGYSLTFLNSGVVQLKRSSSGALTTVAESAASAAPVGTAFCVTVLRHSDGLFEVYIDGVLVCSGTDTTHTASTYQVFRLADTDMWIALGSVPASNYAVQKRLLA